MRQIGGVHTDWSILLDIQSLKFVRFFSSNEIWTQLLEIRKNFPQRTLSSKIEQFPMSKTHQRTTSLEVLVWNFIKIVGPTVLVCVRALNCEGPHSEDASSEKYRGWLKWSITFKKEFEVLTTLILLNIFWPICISAWTSSRKWRRWIFINDS